MIRKSAQDKRSCISTVTSRNNKVILGVSKSFSERIRTKVTISSQKPGFSKIITHLISLDFLSYTLEIVQSQLSFDCTETTLSFNVIHWFSTLVIQLQGF